MNQQDTTTKNVDAISNVENINEQIKLFEIYEAIHEIDSKLRELEIILKLGEFSEKN